MKRKAVNVAIWAAPVIAAIAATESQGAKIGHFVVKVHGRSAA